jgi:hypothetical protein
MPFGRLKKPFRQWGSEGTSRQPWFGNQFDEGHRLGRAHPLVESGATIGKVMLEGVQVVITAKQEKNP